MPPDASSSSSPNPNYDFILKDKPQPKKSLKIPSFGLPKKAAGILLGALALFLVIILVAAIFRGGGNATSVVGVLGRGQEILRVTKLVEPLAQSSGDTLSLASTTEAAFASQQVAISNYLAKAGVKSDAKSLALYQNKNTDAQLQAAAQNNNLDSAYATYLKKSLADYRAALQAAAKGASPTRIQILNDAFGSTQTLLSAPQVANASS